MFKKHIRRIESAQTTSKKNQSTPLNSMTMSILNGDLMPIASTDNLKGESKHTIQLIDNSTSIFNGDLMPLQNV